MLDARCVRGLISHQTALPFDVALWRNSTMQHSSVSLVPCNAGRPGSRRDLSRPVRHLPRAARERPSIPAAYTTIAVIRRPSARSSPGHVPEDPLPGRAGRRDHDDEEDEEEGAGVRA